MRINPFLPSLILVSVLSFGIAAAEPQSNIVDSIPPSANKSKQLEEFKNNQAIQVSIGSARVFNTNSTICRTAVSDPRIAEPVVVSQEEVMLIGKTTGRVTLMIWGVSNYFESKNPRPDKIANIELEVVAAGASPSAAAPPIPVKNVGRVSLKECKMDTYVLGKYQESRRSNAFQTRLEGSGGNGNQSLANRPKVESTKSATTLAITLQASHMKAFKVPARITKIVSTGQEAGELVQLSPFEFQIIGKKVGNANITILDSDQNTLSIDVSVIPDSGVPLKNDSIPPVVIGTMPLAEYKLGGRLNLAVSQCKVFEIEHRIVRTAIANGAIAEFLPGPNAMYLIGKKPGTTTLFLWDDQGNVSGFDLRISPSPNAAKPTLPQLRPSKGFPMEIETWQGEKKQIQYWPVEKR